MTETLPLVAETVMSMIMVMIYMTTLLNKDLISRSTVKCADISASHASRERLMLQAKIAFLNKTYQVENRKSWIPHFLHFEYYPHHPLHDDSLKRDIFLFSNNIQNFHTTSLGKI